MAADEPEKSFATAEDGSKRASVRPSMRPGGASSLVGLVVSGRYQIEKLLGEGGMGAVYLATHVHMRKKLAVKVLHPEMSRLTEVRKRFENEAVAASHIEHPNVVAATDFGQLEDGSFFLVMEYVEENRSLRDAIGAGRLEVGRALHVMRQIASALQRAHALGIVHRDLKPENVMLMTRDGDPDFVKVLDFGIAKVPVGEIVQGASDGKVLTQLGMVYGTPEYMAPEQALGQAVDPRADLYALGVMTFEMLTGTRPYDHESKVALLGMHVTAPIPLPSERAANAAIPPEVDAIIKKLLAKETTERFQDAKELIDAANGLLAQLVAQGRTDARYSNIGGGPASTQLSPGIAPGSVRQVSLAGVPGVPTGATAMQEAPATTGPIWTRLPFPPRVLATAGAGIVGALTLVIVLVALLSKGGTSTTTLADGAVVAIEGEGGAAASTTRPPQPPAKPEVEAQIRDAIALVSKGDYGTAVKELTELEQSNAERADIHRALVDAYIATKHPESAMEEAEKTLTLDPGTTKDKDLRLQIRNTALTATKEAEEKAFALLETAMGSEGPDILYDIAYIVSGYPRPATRAKASLKKAEVRAKATEELKVALEIRDVAAKSACDLRKYLDHAAESGDWRTAQILKGYNATRGCGFLSQRDCWPCLHGDGALQKTIKAIEERSRREP